MEDVPDADAHPDDSTMTDDYDESLDQSRSQDVHEAFRPSRPEIMESVATDSAILRRTK